MGMADYIKKAYEEIWHGCGLDMEGSGYLENYVEEHYEQNEEEIKEAIDEEVYRIIHYSF